MRTKPHQGNLSVRDISSIANTTQKSILIHISVNIPKIPQTRDFWYVCVEFYIHIMP